MPAEARRSNREMSRPAFIAAWDRTVAGNCKGKAAVEQSNAVSVLVEAYRVATPATDLRQERGASTLAG